jgi:hypothetical protein
VDQKEEDLDRFERVLAATVDYVGKEPIVLAYLEQYFSPQPASLANDLDQRLHLLAERLGGPPNQSPATRRIRRQRCTR